MSGLSKPRVKAGAVEYSDATDIRVGLRVERVWDKRGFGGELLPWQQTHVSPLLFLCPCPFG